MDTWQIFSDLKDEFFYKPIRVTIPASAVKAGPPLSPILILNRLDMEEFCRLSMDLSSFLLESCPTALLIRKNYFDDFILDLKVISFMDFFD